MNRESLIGYSMNFASFLIDNMVGKHIKKIILFGSVARGDFTKESDIDIFIDTDKENEKEIGKQLKLFTQSKANEIWKLKGVENEISIKVGDLNKWSLKRSIVSSGILLYGKYKEVPENVKYYVIISMSLEKLNYASQMSLWRRLYGYKQKIGRKTYETKGLLNKLEGKKIGKAVILVPSQAKIEIIDFLNKNKVKYTINDLWSDNFE